jgi:hypothetical protein
MADNSTNTLVARLVRQAESDDPKVAEKARQELDRLSVQFQAQKRSGIETR